MQAIGFPALQASTDKPPGDRRLSSLAYRSQAVRPFSEGELQQLLASAQARNRAEAITGLLMVEEGRFFQWLEGPPEGIARVWHSIRRDPRHAEIELLGDGPTPVRFFGGLDLKLARRSSSATAQAGSPEMAERLLRKPPPLLSRLADDLVIPGSMAASGPAAADPLAARLARLLVAAEPEPAFVLIREAHVASASLAGLCAGLFEPAARVLGDLWMADECSEFDVTLGLCRLAVALRGLDSASPLAAALQPAPPLARAVLVATTPNEPHLLGAAIASELYWRAGWDMDCDFPCDDAALGRLVHARWFDVLALSLSSAFTREHRLGELAATIRAVRAGSCNPGLVITLNGRLCFDLPQAVAEAGADAACASALQIVAAARCVPEPQAAHHR